MAVIHFPSGATITTFTPPPPGFDPLSADEATLRSYGLPPRPMEDPVMAKIWEKLVDKPTRFIEPTFRRMDQIIHWPRRSLAAPGTSDNWSGVVEPALPTTTFTAVAAQWVVPHTEPAVDDGTPYYASCWIGIDGEGSTDVFQAGVQCKASYVGNIVQRTIYAWSEWYPEYEVQIPNFPVSEGDTVSCLLTVISDVVGNVLLKNLSLAFPISISFQITPPTGTKLVGNCAEWIVERPGVNGVLSNLANYGSVDFAGCAARRTKGRVGGHDYRENVNMLDGAQIISQGTFQRPDSVRCKYSGPTVFAKGSVASLRRSS
jgi:hypothetical protein